MNISERKFLASQVFYSLVIAHTAGQDTPLGVPTNVVRRLISEAFEIADDMIEFDKINKPEQQKESL